MGTIFSRVKLSGKHVAALLALMLLSAVTAMLLPTALASMIDIGVAGENRNTILIIAVVMATLAILGCLFNMAATVLSAKVSTKFAADLRREIFHQVQDFSAAEMERFGTASLVTRSTSDVTNIQMFLSLLLRLGVTAPLMAVAGLVLSSLTGGELSSVLSLAIPALIIGVGVILIFVSRYSVTLRQRIDRLNKIFLETLEGVRVIRAFNRQGKEMERFSQANGELASMTILSGRVTALLMPVIQVIFGVTTAAVMGMGSWYVSAGEMAVGDLVANSQYISMILAAIMMLALVIMLFPVSYACAKRIAEVLNTESSIKDGRYSAALRKGRACVAFDHVTFTYPGADEPVLKDVSFECRAGEVTAIIGRTGCGKSSILKLIPRLYDATVGHVYVDDMNVKQYKLNELRDLIGYIPQKNVLFSGDVASNLRFGDQDSSEEQWRQAAYIACADEFIEQKPDGYAQYLLSKLTLMGEGVPKDMDAAYEWFAAARNNGHTYAEFFMKRMERGEQEPPSVLLSATRLLYHMGNIFRDNAPAPAANGIQIDRKRLAQLRQKRVALGHKPDDHELEQQQGFSMKFHM